MRFEELYARQQCRDLTMGEAAEMLGVTERTFRRWRDRYDADGATGLQDRRLGRPSGRAVPVDEALRMVTLILPSLEARTTGMPTITRLESGPSIKGASSRFRCRPMSISSWPHAISTWLPYGRIS